MTSIDSKIPTITLTPSAYDQLTTLIEKKRPQMPTLFLRIFAAQGCGGTQYGFSFVSEKTKEDTDIKLINSSDNQFVDLPLLTDKDSATLIDGASLDFSEDEKFGPRFIVNNPNDQGKAGCASCSGGCGGPAL